MDIYRSGSKILTVHPATSDKLVRKVMGDNRIELNFDLTSPFTFALGDYVYFQGEKFSLNVFPKIEKESANRYSYTALFEGLAYELRKVQHFYFTANLAYVGGGDFSLMGTAELHLRVVVENLNRVQSGWTVGVYPSTDAKNITFSSNNCLEAITSIADEFETEYWIGSDKTVNIGKKGSILALTFEYGKGKGLYKIERDNVSSKDIVTRLYPFGSESNLPKGYRDNAKRLQIETAYIDNNVATYGIIENSEIFDDIKPERTGTVTGIDSSNVLKFSDSSMEFDLNATDEDGETLYLISGTSAKIHFQTGDLAGYEFELSAYDHSTQTFTLVLFTDEQAYDLPNSTLKPAIGDEYVIIDIYMPQSYVDDAEARLLAAALESLTQNSEPNLEYSVEVDPLFIKNEGVYPTSGDYVTIKDTALGINRSIRITGIERNLNNDNKYSLTLADTVEPSLTTQVVTTLQKQDIVLEINKLKDPARARRNYKATSELVTMIDTVKAEAILIGNDPAAQYSLTGVAIRANYNSDPNQFNISGGTIYHNYYPVGNPGTWTISYLEAEGLNESLAYYVYIRASKSASTAIYVVSATKIGVEDVSGYYYFPLGVLSSVIDGARVFTTTKGYTLITGDCIKTGILMSSDGLTYFDLDSGVIAGTIRFINSSGSEELLSSTVDTINSSVSSANSDISLLNATISGAIYADTFNETQAQYASRWTNHNGSGNPTITAKTDAVGGNALVVGDGSGNDQAWIIGSKSIPFDPTRLYMIKVRLRRTSGTGTVYIGVAGRNATDSLWVNALGNDSYSSQHYFAADNAAPSTEWTEYIGYFKGTASSGNGVVSSNSTSPGTCHSNVRYIRPMAVVNWASKAGIVDIDYIILDYADAQNAETIANSKNRHFTSEPTTPYIVGDTYSTGVTLYRCIVARSSGNFDSSDWELATTFDNTQTAIDGGLITSGTVQVGSGDGSSTYIKAGITGQGDEDTSVRIWTGSPFLNRSLAPFRVLNNGTFIASMGDIAGWQIDVDKLIRTNELAEIELNSTNQDIVFRYDGVDKVNISGNNLPDIATLISPEGGICYPGANYSISSDGTYSYLAPVSLTLPKAKFSLTTRINWTNTGLLFNFSIYLATTGGAKVALISQGSLTFSNEEGDQYFDIVSKSKIPLAGTYKILYEFSVVLNSSTVLTIGGELAEYNKLVYSQETVGTIIGKNGLSSFFSSSKYLYISQDDGNYFFNLLGNTNIPGVLAAASVAEAGGSSNQWGAKWGSSVKYSTGVYTISHSVGHNNYSVQVTPLAASRVGYVSAKTSSSVTIVITNLSGTVTDTSFDYCIIGNNQ